MIVARARKKFDHYPSDEELIEFKQQWIDNCKGQGGVYFKHSTLVKNITKENDCYYANFTLEIPKIKFWSLAIFYLPLIFFVVGKQDGVRETIQYCKNIYKKIAKLNKKMY